MIRIVCLSLVYLSVFAIPGQLGAQVSAVELVRQYRDGEGSQALEVAGYACPADDEYRDAVFRGLLALPPTPARVNDLAGALRQPLRACADPRVDEWYRHHVRRTTDPYAGLALALALGEAPSPENLAALKDAVIGENLPVRIRGAMLAEAKSVTAEEQVAWLVEGHLMNRSIPIEQLHNRFVFGIGEMPAKGRARVLILDAISSRPDLTRTPELIALLAGDALSAAAPVEWRQHLTLSLEGVAENGMATPAARSAARHAAESIRRLMLTIP